MAPALDGVIQGGEVFVYAVYGLTWLTILGYTAFVILTRESR
jgi:hypothetical protein